MDEGLLHFLVPGQAHLRILTVESTLYLPGLHELLPQVDFWLVIAIGRDDLPGGEVVPRPGAQGLAGGEIASVKSHERKSRP